MNVLLIAAMLNGMLAILESPLPEKKEKIIDELVAQGPEGFAELERALSVAGYYGRMSILTVLEKIGPASIPLLVKTVRTHRRNTARRFAIDSLGEIGGKSARDSLLVLLPVLDAGELATALKALGTIGDPESSVQVRSYLMDADRDVRRRAVIALGEISGMEAIDRILDAFSDDFHGVRFAASLTVENLGGPAGAELAGRMRKWAGPSYHLAIRTLGRLKYEPAAGILVGALRDEDWGIRGAAAEALGLLGGQDSPLEEALETEWHPFVRDQIQDALKANGR